MAPAQFIHGSIAVGHLARLRFLRILGESPVLTPRIRTALVVLAASAGLSACTAYGSPYGGTSIGVGIGSGSPYYGYGYGSPYGYGYGGPYGYNSPYFGYGSYPYFGWNDGFYYPGAGYWVYDPWGRQYPINTRQSNYWSEMLRKFREERGANAAVTQNFAGFRAKAKEGATIKDVDLDAVDRAHEASVRSRMREMRRQAVSERKQPQAEQRTAQTEQSAARAEQRAARAEQRAARSEAREARQESTRERVIERRRERRGGGG
jgi:hypothetical protein